MSLFCTKNLIILLIGLIGFFPYMPLVHADTKEVSLSESHHCTSHEDKVPHSGDHEQKALIKILPHTLDPPSFSSENLIGIIKIMS